MARTLIGNMNTGKSQTLRSVNELLGLMAKHQGVQSAAFLALTTAIDNRVRYDAHQNLSPEEKLTVNSNIGSFGTGGDAEAVGFEFKQLTPISTWVIPVPLSFEGRLPAVFLYNIANEQITADVAATPTMVVVSFPYPTAGRAILN